MTLFEASLAPALHSLLGLSLSSVRWGGTLGDTLEVSEGGVEGGLLRVVSWVELWMCSWTLCCPGRVSGPALARGDRTLPGWWAPPGSSGVLAPPLAHV